MAREIELLPMFLLEWDAGDSGLENIRGLGLAIYVRLDCPFCHKPIEIQINQCWKAYQVSRYMSDSCPECWTRLPAEDIWNTHCVYLGLDI